MTRSGGVICLVTDRRRLNSDLDPDASMDRLVTFVRAAAEAGVDLVQLRERDLEGRDLERLTRECVEATAPTSCRILLNDRADVALAAGAHGVHLRSDSLSARLVRTLNQQWMIGRSVHSASEARRLAAEGGLDYLILGTMFPTSSKPGLGHTSGLAELDELRQGVSVPVLAIGGITLENAGVAIAHGAAGMAGIGLFIPPVGVPDAAHLGRTVAALRRLFDTSGNGP